MGSEKDKDNVIDEITAYYQLNYYKNYDDYYIYKKTSNASPIRLYFQ